MDEKAFTQIEFVSEWVSQLKYEHIPDSVIDMAKLQVMDAMAAIFAGSASTVGCSIYKGLLNTESGGDCTVIPHGNKWSLANTVYYHSAMINALELDNYSFLGHFGQSAISTSLAVGEILDSTGEEFLVAMIAAQEAGGRFSAHLVSGPHQGHMRAFVHRVCAVIATSKLYRLERPVIARALAIALSMPEFPLYPASFSAETKVICTSSATVEGIRAVMLAKEGFEGALDIIEHPVGFLTFFSYMKDTPDIWEHIGKSWVMLTLSFKNYASCAYAQGSVTAANQIKKSKEFDVAEIEKIEIRAPIVSVVMEKFSRPHYGADLTPVNTHFSTQRSVAATLLFGEMTGQFYKAGNFEEKASEIKSLSDKTILIHDWQLTIDMIKALDSGLAGAGNPGVMSFGAAGAALSNFKKAFGSRPLLQLSDIPLLFKISPADRNYFLKRLWRAHRNKLLYFDRLKNNLRSHEGDLAKMEFSIGGHVKVIFKNGEKMEGHCKIPAGFAGDPNRKEVVINKYFREANPVIGEDKSNSLFKLIASLPSISVKKLLQVFNEQE